MPPHWIGFSKIVPHITDSPRLESLELRSTRAQSQFLISSEPESKCNPLCCDRRSKTERRAICCFYCVYGFIVAFKKTIPVNFKWQRGGVSSSTSTVTTCLTHPLAPLYSPLSLSLCEGREEGGLRELWRDTISRTTSSSIGLAPAVPAGEKRAEKQDAVVDAHDFGGIT